MNKKSDFSMPGIRRSIAVKAAACLAAFALLAVNHGGAMTELRHMPSAVFAEDEEALRVRLGSFSANGVTVSVGSSLDERLGERTASCRTLGGIVVRSIPVFVGERPRLTPGGEAVGISIYTDGVLIVGIGELERQGGGRVSPAGEAGLRPGDVILRVNDSDISTTEELLAALDGAGGTAKLLVDRNGRRSTVTIVPEPDGDGGMRIGAWVRDSTVGVGTLSFYEEGTGLAACLGHPVTDADTGTRMKVKDGKLVIAEIIGVARGAQGAPGELHGTFGEASARLGSITANTELGIFGILDEGAAALLSGEELPTAFPDEVHTGEAYIISSASGTPEKYSCRVIKNGRQNAPAPKGLVIEITDERLIELTGGIVQGMSGSPIIQDGKLIGAVTHVFVNDPKKGYGAYAYWMYKELKGTTDNG